MMQLYVKTLLGKILVFEVESTDKVDKIKERVLEKEGLPIEKQRLLFGGQELKDGTLLSEYNLQKESTLTLIIGAAGALVDPASLAAAEPEAEAEAEKEPSVEEFEEVEEVEEIEMTRAEAHEGKQEQREANKEAKAAKKAAKAAKPLPIWDEVDGEDSKFYLGAFAVFLVLALAIFTQIFVAEYNDSGTVDYKYRDFFHPGRVALTSRHWTSFNQQFEPLGTAAYAEIDVSASKAACIVAISGEPNLFFPTAALPGAKEECSFLLPYTAIWSMMSASLVGFAAVAWYARDVLLQPRGSQAMSDLSRIIHDAAMAFLKQEYTWLVPYVLSLWLFIFIAIDGQQNGWAPRASVPFLFGAGLSALCGFFGMSIATEGNCRTAAACFSSQEEGMARGLHVAFRTGACMGIAVVSCGAFGLALSYACFQHVEALSGFGFGSSAVALFARVGGGIYTKAADVGADLCGKVDAGLAEDSPKNPATIADCVGDNVGDVAGMGADLFESFVGAVVAAAVLGAPEFGSTGVALPFWIVTLGLIVSIICTTRVKVTSSTPGEKPSLDDLLRAMRVNVMVAAGFITCGSLFVCWFLFRDQKEFLKTIDGIESPTLDGLYVFPTGAARGNQDVPFDQLYPGQRLFGCIVLGLTVGVLIGMVTEYFTSHTEAPTQSIGYATQFGPGPVIIQGLSMGMYSTVVPLLLIVAGVLGSYYLCGFYGTAIACVGMLSTLGVTMSTDAYGPVSDNAGGIAEMCELPPWVRDYTDGLDALGNTTAATGKGFANGSAVLSAISTLAAFARSASIEEVDLLDPVVVVGLLVGSLLPFLFAAMTMLSVNKAAQEMMGEVRRQFKENPRILTDDDCKPDYERCIAISCASSLREMILPGVMATFAPLVMGFTFGSHCLVGLLIGAISSGYLLGVMMSNTGGAWDNAKKWVEAGEMKIDGKAHGKGTDAHKAAVCGDTVGDPFKDTSGPALNILIKLMTRFAFVLAPLFDPQWGHFWVGLLLLAVASGIVLFIFFYVLAAPKPVEEEPVEAEALVETAHANVPFGGESKA